MALGLNGEWWHSMEWSYPMLNEACGELSSAPGGSTEQSYDRSSGTRKEKAGRNGGGSRELALAFPSHFQRG
jgi:hypothetical protein